MPNRTSHRATEESNHSIAGVLAANDSIAAFERICQEINRTKRVQAVVFGSLFVAVVVGSLWVSEVNVTKFAEGFPGLLAYIRGTLPVIRADHFVADVADWYWSMH